MTGQKESVVMRVKAAIPGFIPYKDVALVMLSNQQLEDLKQVVTFDILNGTVDYGKDRTNRAEVTTYARSMVMNHLKKCRELNGNIDFASTSPKVRIPKVKEIPGLTMDLLPQDLQDYIKSLV